VRAKRETKAEKVSRVNGERWEMLARLHGYNELARLSGTLGERVYCRLICQDIEKALAKDYGVTITHTEDKRPTVLTLGHKPPFIIFTERDIEAMRSTVIAYDERKCAGASSSKTKSGPQ
jgi:hypothetical protein